MSLPENQHSALSDFVDLVKSLLKLKGRLDSQLDAFKEEAKDVREYYAPRAEFERWKATEDGKTWKAKQHKHQNGCCAECKVTIELKGSHIDHIKPISKRPELNLDKKNMRLTCAPCNIKKGSQMDE